MTGEEFRKWLDAMKMAKGMNKGECAILLGRGNQWISYAQKNGADTVTALACAALLAGLRPYGKRNSPRNVAGEATGHDPIKESKP